ncbi:MAG TPA: neutral zinc metallopeptidase [Allosphingosinicella sp.]|nr:neutral zinc metallopeptidase [Allosphingosinicella sp.]
MRFGDRDTSDNVESQRGMGGGGGGMGGGLPGMLFGLVASRFGIGGIIVFAIVMFMLGGNPLGMMGGGGTAVAPHQASRGGGTADQICASDPVTRFSCQVLDSTEDQWGRIFAAQGQRYQPPRMVFYDRNGRSGCGVADSAMGPFYCPSDQRIYIDTAFFSELQQRFKAPGDFAQAYVIAHEVGHHIQTITGTADRVRQAQSRASTTEGNALQVRMELQADCYAGVWAASERAALEPGDVEEGLRAAEAIGDDTLQRQSQDRVVPESFTHGTSSQRMQWLRRGLETGNPAACDTFKGSI